MTTINIGDDVNAFCIQTLALDAAIHHAQGWDRIAWLQLCCCRIDRVRRGCGTGTIDHLTAQLSRELAMVATFTFHQYPQTRSTS